MSKNYSYSWDVPPEKEETFLRLVARIESYMAENSTAVDYYPNKIDWCPEISGFVMYVLVCNGGKKAETTTYTGYSGNFKQRMLCHFNFLGGDYTKRYPPLYIAHHEVFSTKKEAMDREKEIKAGGALNFIRNNVDTLKPIKP